MTVSAYAASPGAAAGHRARFVAQRIETATPAGLVVMLYDRLVLDLARGEEALRAGDRARAHGPLVNAQEIVAELLSTLDASLWDGATGLASLYAYLLRELVQANLTGDAGRAAACRGLVEPLRDAWREAASAAVPTQGPAVA